MILIIELIIGFRVEAEKIYIKEIGINHRPIEKSSLLSV